MPLSAVNFVPLTGQIKAADIKQFFDLFTGAMTDQPVTFANTLTVGGFQGAGAAPLRINGVAAQTANMIEARALSADVQPIFSIGPTGTISWGPGGAVGADVTLARSAANQLTLTGLAGTPALVIPVGGLRVSAGNVGIGTAPIASVALLTGGTNATIEVGGTSQQVGLWLGGTVNAVSAIAMGVDASPVLSAQVNGDTLYAIRVNPIFSDNAHTGVIHAGVKVVSGGVSVDSGGVYCVNGGIGSWDSSGGTIASSGGFRLPNAVPVAWRNAANTGNCVIGYESTNRLQLDGILTGGVPGAATGSIGVSIGGVQHLIAYT